MYSFRNDYSEGAHPQILRALIDSNEKRTPGYGEDEYCDAARTLIRARIGRADAAVYFIPGGTQTNQLMISAALRPHEAVISARSGHINTHETGAIEATGHKVLAIEAPEGKLTPELIDRVCKEHADHHMVKPRMVYLSDATELGTIYQRDELDDISRFCRKRALWLFLDGARLGSALEAQGNDLTLSDIARMTDCFYIGGTKNGALFGEALVITRPELKADFPYLIKQRGALFAKGRLLGVQFKALFEGDLFFEIARHENEMAACLKRGLMELGVPLHVDTPTNQIFPVLQNEQVERLSERCVFEVIEPGAQSAVIRLVTSWATTAEDVEGLLTEFESL